MVSDKHILSLCNVIEILYEANSKQEKILPDKEFYNEKLSKCLDVKKEFERWQTHLHSSRNNRLAFSGLLLLSLLLLSFFSMNERIHYKCGSSALKIKNKSILQR